MKTALAADEPKSVDWRTVPGKYIDTWISLFAEKFQVKRISFYQEGVVCTFVAIPKGAKGELEINVYEIDTRWTYSTRQVISSAKRIVEGN